MNLSKNAKLSRVAASAGAAQTTVNSDSVDMSGFLGVTFVVFMGTITTGGVQSAKIQQSSDDGVADDWTDLEGSSVDIADDDDDGAVFIEVAKPGKRYLRCVVSRATQDSEVDAIAALQVMPTSAPTTHGTGVAGQLLISPSEGTA